MLRGIFFCFLFCLSVTLKAQRPIPVLLNDIPVINPVGGIAPDSIQSVPAGKLLSTQQGQNLCGVTASFTPGVDSFFSQNTTITFTSTSVNATDLKWLINGFFYYSNGNTMIKTFDPGLYQVSLVASNGNCRDTFSVTIVCSGNAPADDHFYAGNLGLLNTNEQAACINPAKDGGFIIGGNTNYKGRDVYNGILVKLKKKNCVEWSRLLINSTIVGTCSLKDSGFLVCGNVVGRNNFVMRLDKTGATLWARSYAFDSSSYISLGFKHVYEMADGSLVAVTSPFSDGISIVKMNAQGNVLWHRYFQKQTQQSSYMNTAAILEWKSALYVLGTLKVPDTSIMDTGPFNSFLIKLDPSNGQTIWSKMYQAESHYRSTYFRQIMPYGSGLLAMATNYYTLGGATVHPSLQWLDTSGNIYKCRSFTQKQYEPNFPTSMFGGVLPDGSVFFKFNSRELTGLQPGYFDHSYYLKVSDSTVLFEKLSGSGPIGTFDGEYLASISSGYSQLMPWLSVSENMFFTKQDTTGLDNGCSYSSSIFSGHDFHLDVIPITWAKESSMGMTGQSISIQSEDLYPQIRSICPNYLDSCAVLTISGPRSVCSLSDTYTYKAGRNNKCGLPVEWSYEGSLTVINKTDSSLSVRFNAFGSHKITVRLRNSCNPAMDTIQVLAASRTLPLNLGKDTSLCPGNSLVLHASPYFLSYQWQDGSRDSVLTVSAAGNYWVKVIDSCGNSLSDTVQVSLTPPVPLDLGPDRVKCNADTIHLNAPPGFLNYVWSNNYNISSTTAPAVVVNPLSDTAYYLKATKQPGCFAYDTVKIKVYHSSPINLGADRSFCSGDSTVLDAGNSFTRYLWNTGATAQQITVMGTGSYSVTGITTEGCKSYDTLKVLYVFSNPVVQLDQTATLCAGATRTLDAGSFASYLWNDGSTGRTLVVNNTGMFAVQVLDNNGCKGSDTTLIRTLLPLPRNFLPADTVICSYGTLQLRPLQRFRSYQWSTNELLPAILITAPGVYRLRVVDSYDCTGEDSIVVGLKECMKGLYAPTAFTPNGDGKNDVFRPLLFGKINKYEFTVYNRWGQVVYHVTDSAKGWDGRQSGQPQPFDVYLWTCNYQLEGEIPRQAKGTVTLVR